MRGLFNALALLNSQITEAVYEDRCSILRVTESTGTSGGTIRPAPAVIVANVPCAFVPSKAKEDKAGGQQRFAVSGQIHFPGLFNGVPLDVQSTDQVLIAARDGQDAITYQVFGVPQNHQGILIEATVNLASP